MTHVEAIKQVIYRLLILHEELEVLEHLNKPNKVKTERETGLKSYPVLDLQTSSPDTQMLTSSLHTDHDRRAQGCLPHSSSSQGKEEKRSTQLYLTFPRSPVFLLL